MNKIFRVIYSKTKQMKVVVSEIAKTSTHSSVLNHLKLPLRLALSSFIVSNLFSFGFYTDSYSAYQSDAGNRIYYGQILRNSSPLRDSYDLSGLTSTQQTMIKNGLFLGSDTDPSYEYNNDGEYSSEYYGISRDSYLVYNSSSQSYQIIRVNAFKSNSSATPKYDHYTVLSNVSKTAAASLGISMPKVDSSGNQTLEQDTNVTANKNLTVKGDTTLKKTTIAGTLNVSNNKVTGVANGTADTDAANVGQTKALIAAANTYSVDYDGDFGSVTLKGTNGTTVTNVKAGALTASSKDAVNGSQLYTTNQNVTKVQQSLTNMNTTISGIQSDISGIKTTNTSISNDVNTLKSQVSSGFNVTANNGKVKTVSPTDNTLNFVNGDDIAITNKDGAVSIGVKATGTVSSGNTHAVTGGTMYSELRPAKGNYIASTNTTAANLTSLDSQLLKVANDLGVETTNRTTAINEATNSLTSKINSEASARQSDVANLTSKINQEATDRTTAIKEATDSLTSKINTEASARQSDVTNLTSKINQEVTDRKSALDTETKARTDAISTLDKKLDSSTTEIKESIESLKAGNLDSSAADSWGEKIATGTVSDGDSKAISGNTLFNEVRPSSDGTYTYVSATQNTGTNLAALDAGLKTTADSLASLSAVSMNYDSDRHDTATLQGQYGTRLANVKAGELSATSKDAVNGSQLYATNQNLASFANDITDMQNWVSSLSDSVTSVIASSSAVSRYMDTIDASKANTSLNNLDDNGKNIIKNYAHDAVQDYIGQLQQLTDTEELDSAKKSNKVSKAPMNPVATLEAPTVASGSTISYDNASSTSITLAGEGGTTISNVKDAVLSDSSKEAVNGSQLYKTNSDLIALKKKSTTQDTALSNLTKDLADIKTANKNISDTLGTLQTNDDTGYSITANGAKVKNLTSKDNTLNFTGSDRVKVSATENGSLNIDVNADGKVEKGNTDLVTGGAVWDKLNEMNSTVTSVDDKITSTAKKDGSNLTVSEVKSWQDKLGTGTIEKGNTGLVTGGAVADAIEKTVGSDISNLKTGKVDSDASNLTEENVKSWQDKLGTGTIEKGNTGLVTGGAVADAIEKTVGTDISDLKTGKVNNDASNLTDANVKSWQNKLGTGTIEKGNTGLVTGGAVADAIDKKVGSDISDLKTGKVNNDASNLTKDNVKSWQDKLGTGTITEGDMGLVTGDTVYKSIKDISTAFSPVKDDGDKISIGKDNETATTIDVSTTNKENGETINRTITGVKVDPEDLSSAANVGYVNQMATGIAEGFSNALQGTERRLTQNMNKIGAGAAALAALHPGEFDPDDKWDFATGVGHYKNANSTALGVYYHPSEDTLVSFGATLGNGDPMLNAGLSLKLGHGSGNTMSRTQLTKTIKQDREAMKVMVQSIIQLKAEVDSLKKNITIDPSKKESFPDVPKEHWANEAVETLKGNGDVNGYPDGKFHGNQKMTRYEYAQMLFNALRKGNSVSEDEIKEYAPELKQILKDYQTQQTQQSKKEK